MKLVLPVIHHIDKDTTWEQAEIAYKCGADGVFLISHYDEDIVLGPIAKEINSENWKNFYGNKFKLGLNLLHTKAVDSFDIVTNYGLDALWLDNAGINSAGISSLTISLIEKMKQTPIEVFASVAFKYQTHDPLPGQAARLVQTHGFIATTSGAATGSAPSVEKIALMSKATNGQLGVASGMTLENIPEFIPYLSHILVATGVSVDEHRFNPVLLKEFVDICHNFKS
jgi:predicted TIM-barrel enzyme